MSGAIDWEEIGKNSKKKFDENGDKKVEFLRLESGHSYKVRPLGSPVIFHKYILQHGGQWRWAICEDPDTCPVKQKHNVEPRERYAVNVLDRADGKIKIMEGPVTVFKVFRTYLEGTGNSPGGPQGADFTIKVVGSGLKTRYENSLDKRTPFTDEEKSYIKGEGLYKLDRIFKSTPAEEIEEKLFGEFKNAGDTTNTTVQSPAKVEVVIDTGAEVGTSGDDLPW